ncbi:retrovirus-related pol polyprotein from transposon tnt 1-94 [Echinococcus multilocularis]|uniref:Retrovirus-related pol polyprotein from transposon tnt 1-94 n=1 Tax=Echinococcus multilocularis TaxID=6211 RepID=A0A0S4MPX6_ECHMU|nr:retrovirus-related pol polyprotein from transposon tnt 1-94 [Echinococcus multilocularis]
MEDEEDNVNETKFWLSTSDNLLSLSQLAWRCPLRCKDHPDGWQQIELSHPPPGLTACLTGRGRTASHTKIGHLVCAGV